MHSANDYWLHKFEFKQDQLLQAIFENFVNLQELVLWDFSQDCCEDSDFEEVQVSLFI